MTCRARLPSLLVLAFAMAGAPVALQAQPAGDVREFRLGLASADLPAEGYGGFTCQAEGGRGPMALEGWAGVADCAPDPANGLREVFFRVAETPAAGEESPVRLLPTRIAGMPVVLSLLFDAEGTVRGIRAVTDTGAPFEERRLAHLAERVVLGRYGPDWDCRDRPPRDGFTAVGGVYVDRRCETLFAGDRRVIVEARFFRRPGQTGLDAEGMWMPGDYESLTRFEILDPAVPVPKWGG